MALVINTNIAALSVGITLSKTGQALASNFERLTTGLRINRAADDAAGLAISQQMITNVRGYAVLERNANDAISAAQTADGALSAVNDILGRLNELATQGSNPIGTAARQNLQVEFGQLQNEVKRILSTTKFNNVALLATRTAALVYQVGLTGTAAADRISVNFGGVSFTALFNSAIATVGQNGRGTAASSQNALTQIQNALSTVASARANFGAVMNRFTFIVTNIQTARLNISAAASRIRDVDVAQETTALSKNTVLQQAGASVLAQANQAPALALKLLA